MNRTTGLALIVVGIVLLLVAGIEHVAVRVLIVPHLAIILSVIAVLLIAAGLYGLRPRQA